MRYWCERCNLWNPTHLGAAHRTKAEIKEAAKEASGGPPGGSASAALPAGVPASAPVPDATDGGEGGPAADFCLPPASASDAKQEEEYKLAAFAAQQLMAGLWGKE